jgi:hypothetical protein
VQPHYTAAPTFDGVDDPCIDGRLALLPGLAEVAVPDLPDPDRPRPVFMPAGFAQYASPDRGLSFKATRAERYMLKCLRSLADARPGDRHNAVVRISAHLFGLAKAGSLDPTDVASRIKGAAVINGLCREDPDEVDSALSWAGENAEPWRLP